MPGPTFALLEMLVRAPWRPQHVAHGMHERVGCGCFASRAELGRRPLLVPLSYTSSTSTSKLLIGLVDGRSSDAFWKHSGYLFLSDSGHQKILMRGQRFPPDGHFDSRPADSS